jgi:hypothetical protein
MIPFAWALCYSEKDRLTHRDLEYAPFDKPGSIDSISDADRALRNARRPYDSFLVPPPR